MRAVVVIPARYGSTRLPGKPLIEICGKLLVQWVYEGARESKLANDVIVATDDERILRAVENFGGKAVLTPKDVPSGTDRVYEAVKELDYEIVINLQGDEPLITGKYIDLLIEELMKGERMATLAHYPENQEEVLDPNRAKIVVDSKGYALYFSRSPIPFVRSRDFLPSNYLIHVGIYGFRKETLEKIVLTPQSKLERLESLEQLRALEIGIPIKVIVTDFRSLPVDTPEDVERASKALEKRQRGNGNVY